MDTALPIPLTVLGFLVACPGILVLQDFDYHRRPGTEHTVHLQICTKMSASEDDVPQIVDVQMMENLRGSNLAQKPIKKRLPLSRP